MQSKGWKFFWFQILLVSSSINWCFVGINTAWAVNIKLKDFRDELSLNQPSFSVSKPSHKLCQQQETKIVDYKLQQSCFLKSVNKDINPTSQINFKDAEKMFVFSHLCNPYLLSNLSFVRLASLTPNLQSSSYLMEIPNPQRCKSIENPVSSSTYTPRNLPDLHSQVSPEQNLPSTNIRDVQQQDGIPQIEGQPPIPIPSPSQIDEKLKTPETEREERLKRLLQRLQETKQASSESLIDEELGRLRLREIPIPLEQIQPPPIEQTIEQFKPIGYLQARASYFYTSNIFSSAVDPVEDGLFFGGLTLAAVPVALGSNTYLNGSIDGNIIRYFDQSQFNYNQIRFNLGIYQQLASRMYGEFGWNNQQLFYARDGNNFDAGDRFLNENSLRVSLGRRDPLTPKLMLDSFYEFRYSLTDPPEDRNRIINFLWLSLNYYLQRSLQVGLDYQFGLSNFTQRQREDQYHRLYGHLNYRLSNYTNLNLQAGVTLGGSTEPNIDFDGWFFSVNYNLELGRF